MKRFAIILSVLVFLTAGCLHFPTGGVWRGDTAFHKVIAAADRVEVRDTGRWSFLDGGKRGRVLFEVRSRSEVAAIASHLTPLYFPEGGTICTCQGYPELAWYQGTNLITTASIHHRESIRCAWFDSNLFLTTGSRCWLRWWLFRHGLESSKTR